MQFDRQFKKAMLDAIGRGENRSSLFWWMFENHDEIAESAGARIHWKSVTARASALGLADTTGKPFTERNARETWRQARAAVAKCRARAVVVTVLESKSRPPCRMSADWRPQEVIPPLPMRPVIGSAVAVRVGEPPMTGEDGIVMSAEGQAEYDRMMAYLGELDRLKFRFGG